MPSPSCSGHTRWMCQSPGLGSVAGGRGTCPELAIFVRVEERRCLLWPQEGSPPTL